MNFQKTKVRYTHKENDKILEEWNNKSVLNGAGSIETDGVAYKGSIKKFTGSDGKTYHERIEGKEEDIWNNSDKRILFIAKELNDPNNPHRLCKV